MTLVLDVTPGGTASNAYASHLSAATYFEGRVGADAWQTAGSAAQLQALVMATGRLDQETYDGQRASPTQRLAFPRWGLVDRDGTTVVATSIPRAVHDACCEQALVYLQDPGRANPSALAAFEAVQIGPIAVTPRVTGATQTDLLCASAIRLLGRWRLGGTGFRIDRG